MDRKGAFTLCALLALGTWVGAAISTYVQKSNVDKQIKDTFDISAVQIQQLNGSATAHALLWLLIACAATVPLLIVAVSAIVSGAEGDKPEEVAPSAADASSKPSNG